MQLLIFQIMASGIPISSKVEDSIVKLCAASL